MSGGLSANSGGALRRHERNRPHGAEGLDTFAAPARASEVELRSDEVTALCPVTGQPDQYTVTIEYLPGAVCLESKSLKLYLQHFRNEGHFCEALAAQICEEVEGVLRPRAVLVTVEQKARGGIAIKARAQGGGVG